MIAYVTVEGVLGEYSPIQGFYPIPEGVKLVHALRSGYRIVLGTVQADEASVEHWLLINGLTRPNFYEDLLYRQAQFIDADNPTIQAYQAQSLRAAGAEISLVVASDPEAILRITQLGIPSLFFINPAYRWAEYRPDRKRLPRAWEEIDAEMIRQRELRATDPRLNEMEEEPI